LDWANPTNLRLINHESLWPAEYNVIPIEVNKFALTCRAVLTHSQKTAESDWAVFVIQDKSGLG